jgi:hypothetical protein
VTAIALAPEERRRKAAMLACFATQRVVLSNFPLDAEALRPAPRYRFTQPPHAGPLAYELLRFGPSFEAWRGRAQAALSALSGEC